MTIRKFDHITIFSQESYASQYGELNFIAELQTSLSWVAGFFSEGKGIGA
jgi:hypothetical protein